MAGYPIVLVGGLASWPGRYRSLAQNLREISGSEVYTTPITPLDWLLGRLRGYGQLVFEVASVVDRVTSAVPGRALGYVRTEVPDDADLLVGGAVATLASPTRP